MTNNTLVKTVRKFSINFKTVITYLENFTIVMLLNMIIRSVQQHSIHTNEFSDMMTLKFIRHQRPYNCVRRRERRFNCSTRSYLKRYKLYASSFLCAKSNEANLK